MLPLPGRARFILLTLLLLASCRGGPIASPRERGQTDVERIATGFFTRWFAEEPVFATALGVHTHDAKLDSFAEASIARRRAAIIEALGALEALDEKTLGVEAAVDRTFLQGQLGSLRMDLDELKPWQQNPNLYPTLAADAVHTLLKRDFAPICERARAAAHRMAALPRLLEEAKQNLRNPARELTETARETTDGTLAFYAQVLPRAFSACTDGAITAEVEKSRAAGLAALEAWKKFLDETLLPRSNGSYALGAERFRRKLAFEEQVDEPLPVLLERGRRELGRLRAEFEQTAREIDSAVTPREVIERVNAMHPEADDLLPFFRRSVGAARAFVVRKNLVPIPPDDNLAITEAPLWDRAFYFAALDSAGPFDTRGLVGYFYVTPVEPDWPPARKEEHLRAFDRFSVENTIFHEAYPGHHLQLLYARRAPSIVRKVYQSGAFVEGWALYCEQMMIEQGIDPDPRARLVMLQWALLRAARYLAGTAMHTQGMAVEQAAMFLQDNAYLSAANAQREARRFTADPFVLQYQLGKLQILELLAEAKQRWGSRFTLGEFHRRLLETGGVPLPLARRLLFPEGEARK